MYEMGLAVACGTMGFAKWTLTCPVYGLMVGMESKEAHVDLFSKELLEE